MSGIRWALLLATADRYAGLVLSFITLAAVSRILTPSEVGIAVMGWAILSIPYALRDLGTMDFIVQRPKLAPAELRTAATVCAMASLVLTAGVLIAAPAIGAAYGDARIAEFLRVMVLAVLTDAIANPLIGMMRRDMEVWKVVVVNVALNSVTTVVTICLALAGASYMSTAWAAVVGNAAAALLAVCLRPQFWVFRPTLAHWREVTVAGAFYSSMAALMRAYEAVPYLALGRFAQPAAMGYYNRAVQTCQLPEKVLLSGIVSIAFPALAQQAREGRALKPAYLGAIELITAVQWPALLLLALLAPRAVGILFGSQWVDVVPLVQIMALASMLGAAASLTYPVLYAIGDLRGAMRVTLVSLPVSAAVMILASVHGTVALAASLCFAYPFNTGVALAYFRRRLDFSWTELWHALSKSCVVAVASVAGPLTLVALFGMTFDQSVTVQAAMVPLALLGWLAGLVVTGHPLLGELRIVAAALRMRVWGGRVRTGTEPRAISPAEETS